MCAYHICHLCVHVCALCACLFMCICVFLCSRENAVVRSIECSHIVGNFFPFKNESGRTVGCAVVVSLAGSRDRIADARLDTGPARQTGPSTNNLSSYFLGTFGTSGIFISEEFFMLSTEK